MKRKLGMSIVKEVVDERAQGHGWWYFLKLGWKREGYEYHSLHAETKRELNEQLKSEVVPCYCKNCADALIK